MSQPEYKTPNLHWSVLVLLPGALLIGGMIGLAHGTCIRPPQPQPMLLSTNLATKQDVLRVEGELHKYMLRVDQKLLGAREIYVVKEK